jgi:hypothetical protein
MEEGPKTLIGAHPLAHIDQSLTVPSEGGEIYLLGILDVHPIVSLLRLMHL